MKNKILFVFLCFSHRIYAQPEDIWETQNEEINWATPTGFIVVLIWVLIFLDFRNDMKNDNKKPRT